MEETLIKKVLGGIMGIKNGTKTATEVGPWLNKLKPINEGMYNELFLKYQEALATREKK